MVTWPVVTNSKLRYTIYTSEFTHTFSLHNPDLGSQHLCTEVNSNVVCFFSILSDTLQGQTDLVHGLNNKQNGLPMVGSQHTCI